MTETVTAAGGTGSPLRVQLLRGLRIAQSTIVITVLLVFFGLNLLGSLGGLPAPGTQVVLFGAMVAVAVVDAALVRANRFWGRARWPAAAAVLAVSVTSTLLLPAGELVRPAHWALGATGFLGVLLFFDDRLARLLGFLGVHVATMLAALVADGRTDRETLVGFGIVVVSTEGLHLAVAMAGSALRAVAGSATAAANDRAGVRTREVVADRVHADREQRYAVLRAGVLPLLRGMGDGSLSPSDPQVRRRSALEAARLRRMFAVHDDGAGELAGELEALVEMAERRGLTVRFAAGALPVDPPAPVRRAMLARAGGILLAATGRARVTLQPSEGSVVLGVVVDGIHDDAAEPCEGVATTVVVAEGRTWMEARWSPDPLPPR